MTLMDFRTILIVVKKKNLSYHFNTDKVSDFFSTFEKLPNHHAEQLKIDLIFSNKTFFLCLHQVCLTKKLSYNIGY